MTGPQAAPPAPDMPGRDWRPGPVQRAVLTRLANHPEGQTLRDMACVGTANALNMTLYGLSRKDPPLAVVAGQRGRANVWQVTEAGQRVALQGGGRGAGA